MNGSQAPAVFDAFAETYDAWYDNPKGKALLSSEVACLSPLLDQYPRPHVEIGVGTGRLAQALAVDYGVDPSVGALARAGRRGVVPIAGVAEELPLRSGAVGGVLIAFTLCFVQSPLRSLIEARRVLVPDGGLVLGLLPRGTPWAASYARRGAEGHPIYRTAHFYSRAEVESLLEQAGFATAICCSTLFQTPGRQEYEQEVPREGYFPEAGFVAIAARSRR
jgi:SAM-dependent methyltransferase